MSESPTQTKDAAQPLTHPKQEIRIPEKPLTRRSRIKTFRDLLKLKDEQISTGNTKTAEAEELARIDSLTGLPNSRWFDEEIERKIADADRSGEGFWYLFMDVDEFKVINDQFSHAGGDEVLKLFGAIDLRKGDALARIGGDEFAMILKGNTLPEDIAVLVDRVRDQLSALSLSTLSHLPENPNREFLDIPIRREASFSFGATRYNPGEFASRSPEVKIGQVLKDRADLGASFSKKEGRNMGTITDIINGEERFTPMTPTVSA